MNNSLISLPVRLVVLLRRLVNVISSLSLTNQYLISSSLHSHPSDPASPRSTSAWLISAYSPDLAPLGWRVCSRPTEYAPRSETNLPDPTSSLQPSRPCNEQRSPAPPPRGNTDYSDTIHPLMNNPTLFHPARAPRYPIVLCHGIASFYSQCPCLTSSQDYTDST